MAETPFLLWDGGGSAAAAGICGELWISGAAFAATAIGMSLIINCAHIDYPFPEGVDRIRPNCNWGSAAVGRHRKSKPKMWIPISTPSPGAGTPIPLQELAPNRARLLNNTHPGSICFVSKTARRPLRPQQLTPNRAGVISGTYLPTTRANTQQGRVPLWHPPGYSA